MTTSAVLSIRDAIVVLIKTMTTLVGAKAYNDGAVPAGALPPYAILGTASEPGANARYQSQPGSGQTLRINFWAPTKLAAQQAYAEAKGLMTGSAIASLTGHRFIKADLSYVSDFREPAPEGGKFCVVSELATTTLEAP